VGVLHVRSSLWVTSVTSRFTRLHLLTLRAGRGPVGAISYSRDELSSFLGELSPNLVTVFHIPQK
jgi:hypothetical protein